MRRNRQLWDRRVLKRAMRVSKFNQRRSAIVGFKFGKQRSWANWFSDRVNGSPWPMFDIPGATPIAFIQPLGDRR